MGKTLDVIRDRRDDPDVTPLAQETGRPEVRVDGAPGATALKLLLVMHDQAGVSVADDVEHLLELQELNRIPGIRRMSRAQLRDVLREIVALRIEYDEGPGGELGMGTLIQVARALLEPDRIAVRYRFGELFRDLVARSDRWMLIDRPVLLAMRSRYAIALFEHMCSVAWRDYRAQAFSPEELRRILGVLPGRLRSFRDLRIGALDPAAREVSTMSRFDVSYKLSRRGRGGRVHKIVIEWELKDPPARPAELPFDEDSEVAVRAGPANRSPRQRGKAPHPFPSSGQLRYEDHWRPLARQHGKGHDIDQLGQRFVQFCRTREPSELPLDARGIEKAFLGFCRRLEPVPGWYPQEE